MSVISLQQKKYEKLLYIAIPIPSQANSEERITIAKKNLLAIMECDRRAKEAGTLVGRVFSQPVDGGAAYYQVTEEHSKFVTITNCSGLGTDLIMPNWGWRSSVKKDYILFRLKQINTKSVPDQKVNAK